MQSFVWEAGTGGRRFDDGDWSVDKCAIPAVDKESLEDLYATYNRREFVHPDPLEFMYDYKNARDREIVGLIASSLAYGRVRQILKSVATVLARIGSPSAFLQRASAQSIHREFADFRHRFTTGDEMAALLVGVKGVVERYGSLRDCFLNGMNDTDDTVLPAMSKFVEELSSAAGDVGRNSLLPQPDRGSSCKRLNLFLRWMVRRDDVDPGGWDEVGAAGLIVPLDTHMYRIARALDFTKRKQTDMRTALEITEAFKTVVPEDPVRYDFVLTRLGIRTELDMARFVERFRSVEVA